jgi:hypothetical protein
MRARALHTAVTCAAALVLTLVCARAYDDALYPDWKGQWTRADNGVQWDPSKPPGRGQRAPLTAEYQKIYDGYLAEQETSGGQDYNPQVRCKPPGMPRAMLAYEPFELIITPEITYMRMNYMQEFRRIYTDGRDWPKDGKPTLLGTSIGKWIDEDGDGRYDTLEVETRNFHGKRLYENTGIPLHADNRSVFKERIYTDAKNPNVIHDEVITFDNALTRPWMVLRSYRRDLKAPWIEYVCEENNNMVILRGEMYFVREDGFLMPGRKDQPPPDLRNFNPAQKEVKARGE